MIQIYFNKITFSSFLKLQVTELEPRSPGAQSFQSGAKGITKRYRTSKITSKNAVKQSTESCAPEKHTPIFDGSWTRTRVSRAQSPNAGPKGKGKRRETSEYNARTAVNLFLVQILAAVASIHVRPMKTNQRLQKRLHVNSPF